MKKAGSSAPWRERTARFATARSSPTGEVDYEKYRLNFREMSSSAACLAAVVMVLSYAFYDSVIPGLIFLPILFFPYMKRKKKQLILKRKERLKQEFLFGASLLSDYLKSGYSIENAIRNSGKEIAEVWGERSDLLREWTQMAVKLQLNRTVESVFRDFGERSGVEQIREFADIFAIVKRSGGQLGEILSSACLSLSEQFRAEEQIRTVMAAKKLEQKIMDLVPAGILLYVKTASPELLAVLYKNISGRIIMTGCLLAYLLSYLWSEKILEIEL